MFRGTRRRDVIYWPGVFASDAKRCAFGARRSSFHDGQGRRGNRANMRWMVGLLLVALSHPVGADGGAPVEYAANVQPILERHCYSCHAGAEVQADLRLDTAAGAIRGGNSGPAIVVGNSSASLLIKRVTGTGGFERMPPEDGPAPLSDAQIAVLAKWIDQGAHAPVDGVPEAQTSRTSDHWSLQPVTRPRIPDVQTTGWAETAIDRFVLSQLEARGMEPSPQADRTTLVRRLSLDLRGTPPSIAEVEQFLADSCPDAYYRLVDRLLGTPQYGERWARHWLDQARYADSDGYTNDRARSIWKYRDWVIDVLNRDLPFDEFVIDQIAGDLRRDAGLDQIVATGFHRNTQHNREGGSDPEQYRVERVADRVNTTGEVLLGLTIGCARCHDHKFDPITQREYYQLFAFFDNCDEPTLPVPDAGQQRRWDELQVALRDTRRTIDAYDKAHVSGLSDWAAAARRDEQTPADLRELLAVDRKKWTDAQRETVMDHFRKSSSEGLKLVTRRDRLEGDEKKLRAQIPTSLIMRRREQPRTTHIHLRGNFLDQGRAVEPGTPAVLPGIAPADDTPTRLDLARWLVRADNPLTCRVTTNRIWQYHFGMGLVETENDFGAKGVPPSHPRLLDWLSSELIRQEWSLKRMHRVIVASAVYRQSSHARPELREIDPRNRLLARQNRNRLEAEVIRDATLAAAGLLSCEIGGPSVFPPQPPGVVKWARDASRKWVVSQGADRFRRGMYTYFWRTTPHPFLKAFDAPDSNAACTRRDRSNTPIQALMLLNDEAMVESATALALRIIQQGGPSDSDRIRFAFQRCLGREPDRVEMDALRELLDRERRNGDAGAEGEPPTEEPLAWTSVARALLNLDEFITRE